MRKGISLSTLLLVAAAAQAQQATEDVLYLRNGWILRGQLRSAPTDATVRLLTRDRNQFVFPRADVDSVRQEAVQPVRNFATYYKRRGFSHYTELGALAGRNTSSATNTSAFSFQTVNGFKFNQWAYAGLGVGVDLYATQSLVPIFASFRGDLLTRGTLLPYYFLDAGYGINITGRDDTLPQPVTYDGGALYAAGLGLKAVFNNSTAFLISIGYRAQRTTVTRENLPGDDVNFQRIAVRAGFTF